MPAAPPPVRAASPPAWATHGANPIAIFRRGAGRDSLYAGIKGGRARLSHGHMDAGSFILELGGVRWTTDPGMPNYHDLERQGVRLFGEDRWDVFVLGPHSHSIPLIDDLPPDEQATATLLALDENRQSATIDLTPLYRRQLEKLHRTLTVESSTSIRIRDEIEGLAPGARYRFSWMTRASVAPDAAGATLRQNGKTLRLAVTADIPFEIADEDASQPPAAYDAPQPGLRRVSVLFKAAQTTHTLEIRANLLQPQ